MINKSEEISTTTTTTQTNEGTHKRKNTTGLDVTDNICT